MNTTYQQNTKISREFRDVSGDLLRADYNTFETSINFFKSFCEDTVLIQEILKPIIENDFNSKEWYDNATTTRGMVGSGNPTLPNNKLDALKAIYDMLWSDKPRDVLLHFGHSTMFNKNFNEQIRKVNEIITNFLVRYINRELEEKIELVKPQGSENINNWHIYGPSNIASQSQNVSQSLIISNPVLHQTIADLRTAIVQSELPQIEQSEALETVDMIEEESAKQNPSPSKINKLVGLLPAIDSVTSIGANVLSFFSQ